MKTMTVFPFNLPGDTSEMRWQHPINERESFLNSTNEMDKEIFIELVNFAHFLYQQEVNLGKTFKFNPKSEED